MINLNIDDFLENYWQKKPLLIRAAFPNYHSPITADELAGLACEDFVESRIITENKSTPKWSLENGPFPESQFSKLPNSHWTLLIQGLNKIFPEFDDLLHEFNFIPSWRVDDLMASYATPGGSVGPHIDQYDVFLLQASGERKWMISEEAIDESNFEENIPLKIIKDFKAESEWILQAGDMLYLPAGVAHYGIGMKDKADCITFSIGFRAPSHTELLTAYIDDHISELNDNLRYKDPNLSANIDNGEISAAAITQVQELFLSQFKDKDKIADWFGRFITDYLNDDHSHIENTLNSSEFIATFKKSKQLRRPATVRANYIVNTKNELSLFINGQKQNIEAKNKLIAMLFCNNHIIHHEELSKNLSKDAFDFLLVLYNKGYLEFPDE